MAHHLNQPETQNLDVNANRLTSCVYFSSGLKRRNIIDAETGFVFALINRLKWRFSIVNKTHENELRNTWRRLDYFVTTTHKFHLRCSETELDFRNDNRTEESRCREDDPMTKHLSTTDNKHLSQSLWKQSSAVASGHETGFLSTQCRRPKADMFSLCHQQSPHTTDKTARPNRVGGG